MLKQIAILSLVLLVNITMAVAAPEVGDEQQVKQANQCLAFLDHKFRKLHASDEVDLCKLTAGKPVLLVNTASNCGFTPQFKGLEALHKKYQAQGLVVIGFPSDDFFQEEDDEKDTAKVCFVNYGVTFTMLQTTAVRGSDVNPVFKHLGDETTSPKWNFYKYLVSKDGKNIQHFNSRVAPDDAEFIQAIEVVL
ncbi:glutathione peroxidase [Colwellia sp. MEBiC06753]